MRILSVLLLTALLAPAETKQERGKRVVDEALAALGGDHYLAMRDRVESGRVYSFYRERLSGLSRATIYTRYLVRPEPPSPGVFAIRERQAFGKSEESATLFAEGQGWDITFRGARPLDEKLVARYKDSTLHNIFYILRQRLGEPGLIFESQGSDVYENQPVEIVDITDADNRVVTVYFHQSTKLPIRQIYYRRDPLTKERDEEVSVFSKYRDVGHGVQWPFTIQRQRNGDKTFEIYSDSVTVNRDLTDNMFTLPGDMKILKQIP
jgi:hypothetical protein